MFRMNTIQVTAEQAKSTALCTLDSQCHENYHCHPKHALADKITGCMNDDMHVDDTIQTCSGRGQFFTDGSVCTCEYEYAYDATSASGDFGVGNICSRPGQNDDGFCQRTLTPCNCVFGADANHGGCPLS